MPTPQLSRIARAGAGVLALAAWGCVAPPAGSPAAPHAPPPHRVEAAPAAFVPLRPAPRLDSGVGDDGEQSLLDKILFGPDRFRDREEEEEEEERVGREPKKELARPRFPKRHRVEPEERPWWETEPRPDELARRSGVFRAEEGWFLGVSAVATQHSDQDLDGQQFLSGPDTIVLPEVDMGSGGGVSFGYRFESMSFELFYLTTSHDGEWLGTDFDVDYESYGVDFKHYFLRSSRLQPYVSLGAAIPRLRVGNGSFTATEVDDGVLDDDIIVNAGGGLTFYLTPGLSLGGHAAYRFFESYDEAEGVAPKGSVDAVEAGGLTLALQLSYTF